MTKKTLISIILYTIPILILLCIFGYNRISEKNKINQIALESVESVPEKPVQKKINNENIYSRIEMFSSVIDIVYEKYYKEISKQDIISNAMKGVLNNLDPYSAYLDEEDYASLTEYTNGEFGGIGVQISKNQGDYIKIIAPIDNTPASKAKISSGDYITKISGLDTSKMTMEEAIAKLKGANNTKITITILSGIKPPRDVTLTRTLIRSEPVSSEIINGAMYIRVPTFDEQTYEEMHNIITAKGPSNIKGLVIDLRNNPGGLLEQAVAIVDEFVNSGKILSIVPRNRDETQVFNATPGDILNGLPIVVLINEGSASASEILAGSLKDNKRATLVGEKSFGKGSVQTIQPIDNSKSAVRLTIALYYTPSGQVIHEKGIEPDVFITSIGDMCANKKQCADVEKAKLKKAEMLKVYDNYIKDLDDKTDKQKEYAIELITGPSPNKAIPSISE